MNVEELKKLLNSDVLTDYDMSHVKTPVQDAISLKKESIALLEFLDNRGHKDTRAVLAFLNAMSLQIIEDMVRQKVWTLEQACDRININAQAQRLTLETMVTDGII